MKKFICFIFFIPLLVCAQTPGKLLKLQGGSQFVNFGEVLGGTRTITFWLRLETAIQANKATETAILVRDDTGPSLFTSGEFSIYFGKAGTPEAGHLVFLRATELNSFKIKSDTNFWPGQRWVHIACVLHPQLGMQMYVNGIKQQETNPSTDPVYMRSEGNTGPLMLGSWGTAGGYGIFAEFDELRFYNSGLSEQHIRDYMCQIELPSASQLKAYYRFDNANTSSIPSMTGAFPATPTGILLTSLPNSNAPLGDKSVNNFSITSSTTVTLTEGATFKIENLNTQASSVHIYTTTDQSLNVLGSLPNFFGVWFSDSIAAYDADIAFANLGFACDSCAELQSREHQKAQFTPRPDYAINCVYNLPNESPGNLPYREEYWLRPKLYLEGGLPDETTECEGNPVFLNATGYPGATYLWDDGSTSQGRMVDSSGIYSVTIKWHGCTVTDFTQVIYEPTPFFQLPADTAICQGDTLVLVAPLDIDSAKYTWGNGIHFGRKYRVYFAQTIPLTITIGNCSWTDEITVDVIKKFPLSLGNDTLLCLGQELILQAPSNLNYEWNTRDTDNSIRIFNTPGVYWLRAWNDCFSRSDTIVVEYEECDCGFYVANSFTPNGDELNDLFSPVSDCYFEEYEMMIFDRWGEKIFYTDKMTKGWDGTLNGRNLPEGTYTYQLRYKKYTWLEKSSFERGFINLIR